MVALGQNLRHAASMSSCMGFNPTTVPKLSVDTSQVTLQAASGSNEEDIGDEEEERRRKLSRQAEDPISLTARAVF